MAEPEGAETESDAGPEGSAVPAQGLPWYVKLLVVLAALALAFVVIVDVIHFAELF